MPPSSQLLCQLDSCLARDGADACPASGQSHAGYWTGTGAGHFLWPQVHVCVAAATLTATYNDLYDVKRIFFYKYWEISVFYIEPVVGNSGYIAPQPGFLEGLREITQEDGALLCFDEVMTGFRLVTQVAHSVSL